MKLFYAVFAFLSFIIEASASSSSSVEELPFQFVKAFFDGDTEYCRNAFIDVNSIPLSTQILNRMFYERRRELIPVVLEGYFLKYPNKVCEIFIIKMLESLKDNDVEMVACLLGVKIPLAMEINDAFIRVAINKSNSIVVKELVKDSARFPLSRKSCLSHDCAVRPSIYAARIERHDLYDLLLIDDDFVEKDLIYGRTLKFVFVVMLYHLFTFAYYNLVQ